MNVTVYNQISGRSLVSKDSVPSSHSANPVL